LALGAVIRAAVAKKEMISLQDYMSAKESIYRNSWAVSPWKVFSWSLRQLGLTDGHQGDDILPVGKFVVLHNVEEAANEVLRRANAQLSRVDRIYSKKLFQREFAQVVGGEHHLSEADFDILLIYLARDKAVLSYNGQTVKFKGPTETHATAITAEDVTISSLKSLIYDLEIQIDALSTRINVLASSAREAVERRNKTTAIAALRSKKLAQSNLARQSAVLGQLEEVYAKINQAADQVELVRVMEGSANVLRSLNKEVGGIEKVDDIVDQLKEQMTQVDEVGNVIAEIGQEAGAIDEGELDDELAAMERVEQEKEAAVEKKIQEEREHREAIETERRLAEVAEVEREALLQQKESSKESAEKKALEGEIDESARELERLSL
jgi:charged multivesicular body protein 7